MSGPLVITSTQLHRRKPKRWGLLLVALSVLGFFLVQIIGSVIVLVIMGALVASGTLSADSLDTQDKLLAFFSQPAVLFPLQLSMYLTWLGFMLYATFARGLKSFRKDFWLSFKWYDLPMGILLAAAITLLETFILFLLGDVFKLDLSGSDNGKFLFGSTGPWLYITTIGLGGIIGPFFEELYFRGLIMQGFIRYFRKGLRTYPVTIMGNNTLVKHPGFYVGYIKFKRALYRHKYGLSVTITAIFFGLVHYQFGNTLGAILVPFVTGGIGLILGFIAIKTRRLGINIFTHMAFNTIAVVLSLTGVSIGS